MNQKLDAFEAVILRIQHRLAEIRQPPGDLVRPTRLPERVIIRLAALLNDGGERDQRRLPECLRERLLRQRPPETPVAILKRMNRLETQVRDASPGQARQRRGRMIEPLDELPHLLRDHARRRSLEVNHRIMQRFQEIRASTIRSAASS